MPGRRVLVPIAVLLLASPAFPARATPASPSAEMLEFLGTFQTVDGKVIDPLAVNGAVPSTTKKTETKKGQKKGTKEGKTVKRKKSEKEGCYD